VILFCHSEHNEFIRRTFHEEATLDIFITVHWNGRQSLWARSTSAQITKIFAGKIATGTSKLETSSTTY
jgi:hypothetical protein